MKITRFLKRWSPPALCGLAGWLVVGPLRGQAATTNVSLTSSFTFSPAAVTINANDTVQWVWTGAFNHTTTSDATPIPLWDSGLHTTPFSFSHTFPSTGSFPYHCTNHVAFNMRGSVIVQAAANTPPTVTVTNPANGVVLSAPATIALAATASDPGGSVTNVQFFQGSASLANVTSSPYSVIVANLVAGDYTFSAVAADNGGLTATNAITVHVVTPVPIVLSAPQRVSATAFQFNYSASPGLSYVVLRSGALSGFAPINTNTANSSTVNFLDNNATGPANFYGVHLLPNP